MTVYKYFDELKVGDRQVTRGRTITEADLVNFAGLTGDYYSLHTDAEYAKTTLFGERIAHGLLVLSYAVGQMDLPTPIVIAFYGIDQLRFIRPVKLGDTIHAELEVSALDSRDDHHGLSTVRVEIKNQRGEVVIAAIFKWLLAKRA